MMNTWLASVLEGPQREETEEASGLKSTTAWQILPMRGKLKKGK